MNIQNLTNANELLRKEINPKEVDDNFSELCHIIGRLTDLIKKLENPKRAKYIERLCNPDGN